MSDETVGQRIYRLRRERGFSQRTLAQPGVSYAYISRVEAGTRTPSVKALILLAAKLDVSALYLLVGTTEGTCPVCGCRPRDETAVPPAPTTH